ncbi:MAG: hypothetical protein ACFFA6_17560 [Promethearchaeota archaeon]
MPGRPGPYGALLLPQPLWPHVDRRAANGGRSAPRAQAPGAYPGAGRPAADRRPTTGEAAGGLLP